MELEVLLMDDRSGDGSEELVASAGHDWVTMVVREGPKGLSQAVVDGLRRARHPVVVVMDADLSHPPEKIPDLILALASGQQFAIGSRYVPGGSTDDDWGFLRWLNSRVATWLARPLTRVNDPMAGFFALRRRDLDRARSLNPVGYKIGLELIVKCGLENVGEVPIRFVDRKYGQSKLTLREQFKYLRHLGRLYAYQIRYRSPAARFAAVGASGVVVNLAVLSALIGLRVPVAGALAAGIVVSLGTNYLMGRRIGLEPAGRSFGGFVAAALPAALLNLATAVLILRRWLGATVQGGAACGIAAGAALNYLADQFLVFRGRFGRHRAGGGGKAG
jgi:dolichol-phosphate mannosyltransferase